MISGKGNGTGARSVVKDVRVGAEDHTKVRGSLKHFAGDGKRKLRQTFELVLDAFKGLENDVGFFRAEDLDTSRMICTWSQRHRYTESSRLFQELTQPEVA